MSASSHCIFVSPLPCGILIPLLVCFVAASTQGELHSIFTRKSSSSREAKRLEAQAEVQSLLTYVLFQVLEDRLD